MKYNHFVTRQRLINASGAQRRPTWSSRSGVFGPRAGVITDAFTYIGRWLDSITPTPLPVRPRAKIARNKPTSLTGPVAGRGRRRRFAFVAERQFLAAGRGGARRPANTLYPGYLFPRYMAGMPLSKRHREVSASPDRPGRLPRPLHRRSARRAWARFSRAASAITPRPGVDQHDLPEHWITYTDVGKFKKDREDDD